MIPTFKEAKRAGTALAKFIVMFTPASKADEAEFRAQLEDALVEAQMKGKKHVKLRTRKSPTRREPRSRKHG